MSSPKHLLLVCNRITMAGRFSGVPKSKNKKIDKKNNGEVKKTIHTYIFSSNTLHTGS